MKVCILTTSYPRFNGDYAGNFIHYLAKELVKRRVKVSVVAPHDATTKHYEFMDGVEIYRFKYWFTKGGGKLSYCGGIPYNYSHFFSAKIQLPFFIINFFLKGLKSANKCDVIHAQFLLSGIIGVFIKKITRKKLVITAHGSDIYFVPKNRLLKKLYLNIISLADKIITVSNANKNQLIKLGLKDCQVMVIPNGIDLSIFKKTSNKIEKNKELYICWVGRMIEVKGLECLINSIKIVVDLYPNSKLILIGDGPLKHKLKRLSTSLSLDKNISFIGFIKNEEVIRYLKKTDIFVLPSLSEGLPISILEAMAAGKPVIASNVGGIPDVVKNGITGFHITPNNSKRLAKRICYFIENPEKIKQMGSKGKKIIEDNYTWDIIAKRTISVYKNIT